VSATPTQRPPGGGDAFPMVAVYADESCLGNGREGSNPGGAGGVIEYVSPRTAQLTRWDYWISEPGTTNNRMAIRSVIEAFRIISRKDGRFRVVFTSDSQYLVKGMNEWVPGWIRRGWRRKAGVLENVDLWREAVELVRPHQCHFRWVRGHVGHAQNEYANHLATRAAREQSASAGAVPSEFDDWIAKAGQRAGVLSHPDPFPTAESFRPNPPLPVAAVYNPASISGEAGADQ
jgi:ribonuclease HI